MNKDKETFIHIQTVSLSESERVHKDCPYCQCKKKETNEELKNGCLYIFWWIVVFIGIGLILWNIAATG